jgi:hypothetical protein
MDAMRESWTDDIAKRFDRIDERFERIDRQFDRIDERFQTMDERLLGIYRAMVVFCTVALAALLGIIGTLAGIAVQH